jgi:hypothetical protein
LLLALASAVILGSGSRWTRDHILLFQNRDFPFYRLLWLSGPRWRYSTLPPRGITRIHCLFYNFHATGIEITMFNSSSVDLLVVTGILCLAACYLVTTRSLLIVTAGTWFPRRCSATEVCSGFLLSRLIINIYIYTVPYFWWIIYSVAYNRQQFCKSVSPMVHIYLPRKLCKRISCLSFLTSSLISNSFAFAA